MPKTVRPCPNCRKPTEWEDNPYRPFCSERCKMIDLGLWASGAYKVAGEKISKESLDSNNEEEGGEDEEKGKN